MVDLLRGLVVPRAPGVAAIERDDRALVVAHEHALAVGGVDPHHLRIVAAGRAALECGEAVATVDGLVCRHMERVNDVGILRVDEHAAIVAALGVGDPFVVCRHVAPRRAAIVGAVQPEVADDIDALRGGPDPYGDGHTTRERR